MGSSGTLQEPVHDFADHPLHGRGGLSRQQNRHHEQGKNQVLRLVQLYLCFVKLNFVVL